MALSKSDNFTSYRVPSELFHLCLNLVCSLVGIIIPIYYSVGSKVAFLAYFNLVIYLLGGWGGPLYLIRQMRMVANPQLDLFVWPRFAICETAVKLPMALAAIVSIPEISYQIGLQFESELLTIITYMYAFGVSIFYGIFIKYVVDMKQANYKKYLNVFNTVTAILIAFIAIVLSITTNQLYRDSMCGCKYFGAVMISLLYGFLLGFGAAFTEKAAAKLFALSQLSAAVGVVLATLMITSEIDNWFLNHNTNTFVTYLVYHAVGWGSVIVTGVVVYILYSLFKWCGKQIPMCCRCIQKQCVILPETVDSDSELGDVEMV